VYPSNSRPLERSTVLALVLLGVGLGGFVDGIVLHQVLQWHHMLTSTGDHPADTIAGLETNTLADGLFHLFAWVCVLAGSLLAIRDWRAGNRAPSWATYAGLLLIGWGAFNLVEGAIDHHLLGIHHVRDDVDDSTWWDLGFLALGAAMVVAGAALVGFTLRAPRSFSRRRQIGGTE
jgi:uncharacterized membrane protein